MLTTHSLNKKKCKGQKKRAKSTKIMFQLKKIKVGFRSQCNSNSNNHHKCTAYNGRSCVRPQLSDGSINWDSLWTSVAHLKHNAVFVCSLATH